MKQLYTIAIILLFSTCLFCQDRAYWSFVDASVLNVRSEPTVDSKVVGQVKKHDLVKVIEHTDDYERIDGVKNNWRKIEYDGITGYVFGGYMAGHRVMHNTMDTFDVVFDMYSILDYNPDLNWYGVYSTDEGDKIETVAPGPYLNQKYRDLTGISFVKNESRDYNFFIGTKSKINSGVISVKKYYEDKYLKDINKMDLVLFNEKYRFSAGHKLDASIRYLPDGKHRPIAFQEYKLIYSNRIEGKGTEHVFLYDVQNGCFNKIPSLLWYGDIDNDELPEFIFSVNGDNRGADYEFIKVYRYQGKLRFKRLVSKRPEFAGGC